MHRFFASPLTTNQVAEALNMQRTNVSSCLNDLVSEGKIQKTNGHPTLYSLQKASDAFSELVGFDGSLSKVVKLAKAAVLSKVPGFTILITGEAGSGKTVFSEKIHAFATRSGAMAKDARYARLNCRDGQNDPEICEKEAEEVASGASGGTLAIDNAGLIPMSNLRNVLEVLQGGPYLLICICSTDNASQEDIEELTGRFTMRIDMPSIEERPLSERYRIERRFFNMNAGGIKRTIETDARVLRQLLLYKPHHGLRQLEMDILMAILSAYPRNWNSHGAFLIGTDDFEPGIAASAKSRRASLISEAEKIVPSGGRYIFNGDSMTFGKVSDPMTRKLDEEVVKMHRSGITVQEAVQTIQRDLLAKARAIEMIPSSGEAGALKQICKPKVIAAVHEAMRHCACPQSIEIGLALHIQAIIEGRAPGLKIDDGEYEQFRLANPDLFSTAELLSSSLKENLGLAIDRNEKFVIATFIKDGMQESSSDDHPAILITMLGEGTAESYAAALCRLSMTDGIYGCSFPIGMDDSSIRERARKKLLEISRGKGIVVFYDMDNLRTQTEIAADELGIEAVFVRNGITDRIMDMARRARFAHKASSLANASDPSIASERTQAIITLCETGTGGAVAIAEHIRKYGKLNDTQVIELGILDRSVLREKVGELRKKYRIALIIGAFDPKLFGIHGTMVIVVAAMAVMMQALTANAQAVAAGGKAQFYPCLLLFSGLACCGGTGNTLGLVFWGLRSKSEQLRAVSKAGLIPGLFGVNEPITFGFPIMYNPIMGIPFILTPLVSVFVLWIGYAIGFFKPSYILIMSLMPIGVGEFLGSLAWQNIFIPVVVLILSLVIYYPFFKAYEKQLVAKEEVAKAAEAVEAAPAN